MLKHLKWFNDMILQMYNLILMHLISQRFQIIFRLYHLIEIFNNNPTSDAQFYLSNGGWIRRRGEKQ